MEERPSDRAHEKRYHHGGERSPSRSKTSLKNDPSQCQHQETQTKKTAGNGKVKGSSAERECTVRSASDSVGVVCSADANGPPSQLDSTWKPKQSRRAPSAISKPGSRGYRNGVMDSRSDRAADPLSHEGKKEAPLLPNGVSLPLGPGFFTNGYPSNKPAARPDNEGSGSESGYATPKKRKPLWSGGGKGGNPGAQAPPPAPSPPPPEQADKSAKAETRANKQASVSVATAVPAVPPPAATCEPQRKNGEPKAPGAFGRKQEERPGKAKPGPSVSASSKEKEDSWTLFKPPPVFPVDNSSAKIVPKISYASKVKENLNRAGGEAPGPTGSAPGPAGSPPAPAPGRPSQVPMSAMKTISSSSFANGALCSGEGNAYSLSGTVFASPVPAEGTAPPADESGGALNSAGSALVLGESRKPSIFVYPLAPSSSNMQPALPSGRRADLPSCPPSPGPGSAPSCAPASQQALGAIFQNQWGLSFINEPSAGPEGGLGGAGRGLGQGDVAEVTFQGDCLPALPAAAQAPELEKRTSPQTHSSVLNAGPPPAPPPSRATAPDGQEAAEACDLGAIVFASPKDPPIPVEPPRATPQAPAPPQGLDRRGSWGAFDLKAAVHYHTKEMECILYLQKQDPKRVVLYGESQDGPNQ